MFNRFMVTAATAALIAGTSLAYAQGTGAGKEGPAGGAGMQHSTQSPSTGREGAEHGMKSSQGGEKMQGAQNERAQEKSGTKGESMKGEKSAQENMKGEKSGHENMKGEKSAQENLKGEKGEKGEKSKSSQYEKSTTGNTKAEGREERNERNAQGREERGNMKAEGRESREDRMKAESREGREGRMTTEGRDREGKTAVEGRSQTTTTGQAGAGARLTTEQRTRISTVIRDQHVAPVNNVNFAVTVGTRVPRDIGFHPLPGEIVSIYPEWRGYEYFLVRDEIVVVDPRTLEIVAVLPA
ncbi:MAG TPA: DUF1236 domain-containing protein [Bradyrhizobium sp.]|jgi:hypothetical protein|nr:DUF1236 domain-containing protein [Bradyrhizobium sp.]